MAAALFESNFTAGFLLDSNSKTFNKTEIELTNKALFSDSSYLMDRSIFVLNLFVL